MAEDQEEMWQNKQEEIPVKTSSKVHSIDLENIMYHASEMSRTLRLLEGRADRILQLNTSINKIIDIVLDRRKQIDDWV